MIQRRTPSPPHAAPAPHARRLGAAPAPARRPPRPPALLLLVPAVVVAAVAASLLLLVPRPPPGRPAMRWRRGGGGGVGAAAAEAPGAAVAVNRFGGRLLGELGGAGRQDVVLAPVSVAAAVGMAMAGATEGGAVEAELGAVLGVRGGAAAVGAAVRVDGGGGRAAGGATVVVANSVWVGGRVRDAFAAEVASGFGADVRALAGGADAVNRWVGAATGGAIARVVDDVAPDTVALLVSAVFFRGAWTHAFRPDETVDRAFRAPRGDVTVRMMMRRHARRRYGVADLGAGRGALRLLELPYGADGRFAAVFGLPAGGATLDDVAARVGDEWPAWMGAVGAAPAVISVLGVPRFRAEFGAASVKAALTALGVGAAWGAGAPGGGPLFGRLSDDPAVHLSDVVHKAVVEVTEEGTTAAAASAAVVMSRSISRDDPLSVVVDAPFLFAIRDTVTGLLLFVGRVDNPAAP